MYTLTAANATQIAQKNMLPARSYHAYSTTKLSDSSVNSPAHTGDDSVAIHGRMYTVAAANATGKYIIAASGIISPAELNKGDRMEVGAQDMGQGKKNRTKEMLPCTRSGRSAGQDRWLE